MRKCSYFILAAMLMMSKLNGSEVVSAAEGTANEENLSDVTIAGWHLVVEDVLVKDSMKNISTDLGYTGVETSEYVKDASEGKEFCLVKLNLEKAGSKEQIEWEKMILTDAAGNSYQRIADDFLADLGMKHMPGIALNFGQNEGWICYEIEAGAAGLELSYAFAEETFTCSLSDSTEEDSEARNVVPIADVFAEQNKIDEMLRAELDNNYSLEEAAVIVDPYQQSPLSAVIIFKTEEAVGGIMTVKGKSAENDIVSTVEATTDHIIPVYGLYNGDTTTVEIALENGNTGSYEIETAHQELNFGDIKVEVMDEEKYDYSKLTFVYPFGNTIYALDSAGDIRWCYSGGGSMGIHMLENGHLMVPMAYMLKSSYYKEGLQEIDFSGRIYAQYAIPGGQHHDFYEMKNGNLLVASDAPDLSTIEDYVVELDRATGEVVWELDMKDLITIEDGQSASMESDGSEESDWFHNNGLWYDENNNLVILSARHKDAIVAVKKDEKELAWILGDPTGWKDADSSLFFEPQGEKFEWQYSQHQVSMLDNGDIMMFDNGTAKVKRQDNDQRVTGSDVYSRAVIYGIDTDAMSIEQKFEYGKERGDSWYSDWVSGVISLDGTASNLWITAGSHLYNPEDGRNDYYPSDMMVPGLVKSVTMDQVSDGELVCEIKIEGETYLSLAYRSDRLSFYPEGETLDITKAPELCGSLGVTPGEEVELSVEDAKELASEEWMIACDPVKVFVSGKYSTDSVVEAVAEDRMILVSEEGVKAYPMIQNKTASDQGTMVSDSGWVSAEGLSGEYELYFLLDGELYNTGKVLKY